MVVVAHDPGKIVAFRFDSDWELSVLSRLYGFCESMKRGLKAGIKRKNTGRGAASGGHFDGIEDKQPS